MGKLIQLKGENFLGLGKLKEKIFPITKPEAVIDDDGVSVKNSLSNISADVDNLHKKAFFGYNYVDETGDIRISIITNEQQGGSKNLFVNVMSLDAVHNIIIDISPNLSDTGNQIKLLFKCGDPFEVEFYYDTQVTWYVINNDIEFKEGEYYLLTIEGNTVKYESAERTVIS